MATQLHLLKESSGDYRLLHDLVLGTYLDGECYAFAIALNEGLGWPIIGLIQEDGTIRHAVVQAPDGRYLDARGFVTNDVYLSSPFKGQFSIERIDLQHLYDLRFGKTRKVYAERMILQARCLAEKLWPELLWKNPILPRIQAFVDELEELSRKHQLWIRAQVPGCPPVLCDAADGEGGYSIRELPTLGISFLIDRYFA